MLPLVLLGGVGLYGVAKTISAGVDHFDASQVNDSAQAVMSKSLNRLERQRKNTAIVVEDFGARKLRAFNGVIEEFIRVYGRLKNIETIAGPEIDRMQLCDAPAHLLEDLKNEYQALQDAGLAFGAGLCGGAALAFGAYNGTVILASASTGTAISTLSGAAATNATLAWLGGGSVAAGGGGVAMGVMVLGGLVVGPALAIFGHILGHKAKAAQANAESNLEKATTFSDEARLTQRKLKAIQDVTMLANGIFSKTSSQLRRSVNVLKKIIEDRGVDYTSYSSEDREEVFRCVKLALIVKAMIDTPILEDDGNLVMSTEKRFRYLESTLLVPPQPARENAQAR